MRVGRIETIFFIFPQKLEKLYNILELFNAKSNSHFILWKNITEMAVLFSSKT